MPFKRGDHVCAIYSTTEQLVQDVAAFLVEGLQDGERCWYVGEGAEIAGVAEAVRAHRADVAADVERGALQLLSGEAAYIVHGGFDPEATMRIFNEAIESAYNDGFTGFRAAAEMSWALECSDGAHQLIVYEALLKSLFASCRATGLCLYDRQRMPLDVINGALSTHPVAGSHGHYRINPFYDPEATGPSVIDPAVVRRRLAQLDDLNTLRKA